MKSDDRTLSLQERERVERHALDLLHKADAWGRIPAPVDDILSAAKLTVAPYSIFDPRALAAYAAEKGLQAAKTIKQALGKIFGILDASAEIIHIDDTVTEGRQKFLKLHETGHFQIKHQRKVYRFFEDSSDELDPSISDLFEREANNFASFIMFNGETFCDEAADLSLSFGSAKKMQAKFKVSLYAAVREYTRTHRFPCFAMCLERPAFSPGHGVTAEVRRVETSTAYDAAFDRPRASVIGKGHILSPLIPVGRKATRPTTFRLVDRNGASQEFVGEALDTTFNILVFACPVSVFKT